MNRRSTNQGEVSVRASVESRDATAVELRFTVRDSDIGIPADKRDRLFAKFSQVDASTTRRFGGTGLGLAISKQLAELMGGRIGVHSRAGEGSEFWFTARLALQESAASRVESTAQPSFDELRSRFQGRGRILLVEDNITNRMVATAVLNKMGLAVDSATNGLEAIEALSRAVYGLVLMDVQMPVMDGLETTRHIRDPGSSVLDHGVAVVAMTAHAMARDREDCLAAGMNDYVSKPVDPQKLADALARWLG